MKYNHLWLCQLQTSHNLRWISLVDKKGRRSCLNLGVLDSFPTASLALAAWIKPSSNSVPSYTLTNRRRQKLKQNTSERRVITFFYLSWFSTIESVVIISSRASFFFLCFLSSWHLTGSDKTDPLAAWQCFKSKDMWHMDAMKIYSSIVFISLTDSSLVCKTSNNGCRNASAHFFGDVFKMLFLSVQQPKSQTYLICNDKTKTKAVYLSPLFI